MSARAALTLVVPCYNEAARLDTAAFLRALREWPWLAFCFVNDGSTDATPQALAALQAQDPVRIDVLTLPRNSGKAEAVRQGMLRVVQGEGAAVPRLCGFWDADLSAPLAEVVALAAVFDHEPAVQWVWAIRLRSLGRTVTRSALRHYLGRGFATAASLALGLGVYDTQCGSKLFRVNALLREVLGAPFVSRWVFDVEMLSRADALLRAGGAGGVGEVVYEQPLREWHHRAGSKVRPADCVRAALGLLRMRRARHLWERPMAAGTAPAARAADRRG